MVTMEEEMEQMKHHNKMRELEYTRKTIEMEHEKILERERIKRAEQRKDEMANLERQKELILFRQDHWNKPKERT